MVREVEKGELNMRQNFGVAKNGYTLSGWYLEGAPNPIDYLEVTEDCDVYGKWEKAEYITVTIDQSYLNKSPLTYKVQLDMDKNAFLTLPKIDDKNDVYNHVFGCTYGYSTRKPRGKFGTIEYYGGTECKFTKDVTLYRVLNKYGGGDGTKKNPYIIDYYDQLLYLAENKAVGFFKQTADIKFPVNTNREPICTVDISDGYEDKYYDLFVYDGGNYTIKNLSGEGGLFGTLAASAVKNVRISGANITVKNGNGGILCNEITSYAFGKYGTGNSRIQNCTVSDCKITGENAENIGGIVGFGGNVEYCLAEKVTINGTCEAAGGIAGNACTVKGSLSNSVSVSGNILAAGGIAGTSYGAEIYESADDFTFVGGDITGCGVRTFTSTAVNSGGIVGLSTACSDSFIKSCYAANIYLNGENNGGISGADGDKNYRHRAAYVIIDNTNGYAFIGGDNPRSTTKMMVLSVPADSGLTVDGVLSVLNASGSGFDGWKRKSGINSGYPYPSGITF